MRNEFSNEFFEWDEKKAQINIKKHHVTFWEAMCVFDDPYALTVSSMERGELRHHSIGRGCKINGKERLLSVIWTERGEKIRIISAWQDKKTRENMMNNLEKDKSSKELDDLYEDHRNDDFTHAKSVDELPFLKDFQARRKTAALHEAMKAFLGAELAHDLEKNPQSSESAPNNSPTTRSRNISRTFKTAAQQPRATLLPKHMTVPGMWFILHGFISPSSSSN